MTGVEWHGLDEYIDELREAPKTLARDSEPVVNDVATETANEIRAAYPRRTGHLAESVVVRQGKGNETKAAAQVVNTAAYAVPFEYGTQARHTAIGANRGSMPAGKVFVPIVLRRRREMLDRVAETVLVPQGATVTRV